MLREVHILIGANEPGTNINIGLKDIICHILFKDKISVKIIIDL